MKNCFVFFVILLLVRREVNAVQDVRQDAKVFSNAGKNDRKKVALSDPFEEEDEKWNIDLSDMLKYKNYEEIVEGSDVEEKEKKKSDKPDGGTEANDENGKDPGGNEGGKPKEEPDVFRIQIQEYLLRYVNLFLYSLNLRDKETTDENNEQVKVSFEFVISAKDLKTLQDFTKDFKKHNIFDQLYLIDVIISKGMYVKDKDSFYEEIIAFFSTSDFPREIWKSKNLYFFIFGMTTLFLIIGKYLVQFSYKFIFFVLVNNLIILEGVFNYFAKLKEANIADYVERLRYKSEPDACNMEEQSIFGKIYDMFSENACLTYHRNIHISRADTIFPLESIVNAYSFYIVEMPCKIVGSGISTFVVSINHYLPAVLQQFGEVTTQFVILVAILVGLIIFVFSPVIRFNFWGARVELIISYWARNRERYLEDAEPEEQRRIFDLPVPAIVEIEEELVQQLPDYEEGLDAVSEVVEDNDKMEEKDIEESSIEDNDIEIIDEDIGSDNESFVSEEGNLLQDIKIAKELLAELKDNE